MMYLLSNGGQYSDHRIIFLDCDLAQELVDGLAKACFGERAHVIAQTVSIQWAGESKAITWDGMVREEGWRFFDDDELEECLHSLPVSMRDPVRDLIRQVVKGCCDG